MSNAHSSSWVLTVAGMQPVVILPGQQVEIGRKPIRPLTDAGVLRVEIVDNTRSMSKRHAVLQVLEDGGALLRDAASTNGTYVIQDNGDVTRIPAHTDYVLQGDSVLVQFGDVPVTLMRRSMSAPVHPINTNAAVQGGEAAVRSGIGAGDAGGAAGAAGVGLSAVTGVDAAARAAAPRSVEDLFASVRRRRERVEPRASQMSVDDILDVRAGEPTQALNASQVALRVSQLHATQAGTNANTSVSAHADTAHAADVKARRAEPVLQQPEALNSRMRLAQLRAEVLPEQVAQQVSAQQSTKLSEQPFERDLRQESKQASEQPAEQQASQASQVLEQKSAQNTQLSSRAMQGEAAASAASQAASAIANAKASQALKQSSEQLPVQAARAASAQAAPQMQERVKPQSSLLIEESAQHSQERTAFDTVTLQVHPATQAAAPMRNLFADASAASQLAAQSTSQAAAHSAAQSDSQSTSQSASQAQAVEHAAEQPVQRVAAQAQQPSSAQASDVLAANEQHSQEAHSAQASQTQAVEQSVSQAQQAQAQKQQVTPQSTSQMRSQKQSRPQEQSPEHFEPAFAAGSVFARITQSQRAREQHLVEVDGFTSEDARRTSDFTVQFQIARRNALLPYLALNPSLYDDLYAWLAAQGNADIDEALAHNAGYTQYLRSSGKLD